MFANSFCIFHCPLPDPKALLKYNDRALAISTMETCVQNRINNEMANFTYSTNSHSKLKAYVSAEFGKMRRFKWLFFSKLALTVCSLFACCLFVMILFKSTVDRNMANKNNQRTN